MSKRNHLKERLNKKLEAITFETLIVGVDIAKHNQWARFVDCRGIEHNKALKFENNRNGFNAILTRIYEICKQEDFNKVIVGMEPTGHYWKAFANFLLKQAKITVVLVNPYHTKKAKELDDNSQTKSDKKDALTIARLVKDGRYFETYLPHDVYAELRGLTTTRHSMNKRKKSIINTITAVLDEYFPEYGTVFKQPFKGKASMHLLKVCPIPKFILELGEDGVLDEIKKAVKKTVGRKKAAQLLEAAKDSIGVDYGEKAARFKIQQLMEELELITNQLKSVEEEMSEALKKTEIAEYLMSIPGIGVVSLATCLGELGDPLRFENARQMSRLAGYNLIEDSSGKNKSGTCISKRGRKNLRSVLYQISLTMVANNKELRQLYDYLKTREKNPLKKMQALVVISKKVLTLIFTLSKKKAYYEPELVFGSYRKSQLQAA
ncbi:MAG: IS110 family transposase [Coprococcus sp.]|jgi:transposase|nr:IS110 family transposase [Coprococcus sp.]